MHQPEIHVTIGASEPTPLADRSFETKRSRGLARTQALKALTMGRQTVYAVRMPDGVIKIGCTSKLWSRRNSLGSGSEIIGFIFGDFGDEAAIHERLKPCRARGHEYYRPVPEVMAEVNAMRDVWNLPHVDR